jgi:phage tail tape-measure protein
MDYAVKAQTSVLRELDEFELDLVGAGNAKGAGVGALYGAIAGGRAFLALGPEGVVAGAILGAAVGTIVSAFVNL